MPVLLQCSQCGGHRALAPIPSLDPKFKIAYCYDCRTERLFKNAEVDEQEIARNLEAGIIERDRALQQAMLGKTEWKRYFDRELHRRAETGQPFSSEDITAMVGVPHRGASVIGARMAYWAKKGVIERVGDTQAERVNQHAARIGLWRGKR